MENVAIIVHALNNGGAERIAGLLSKELQKYYTVYIFLSDMENIVYEYGGTIIDIGRWPDLFYEYNLNINKKKYHIDCAISFLEPMNFANIRTRGEERVIISERCVQSLFEPVHSAESLKIRRYYDYADTIVTVSEGAKFDLVHNYGVRGDIQTIYNFINQEKILTKSQEEIPIEIQKFLNGAEYFLNMGRLHPQKNQKRLILQFSYFHTICPGVKLLILGSGELESELSLYIETLKLDNHVKIIPYTANPFAYLAKAKALVLSSHYEGLPNAILEAMTLGRPVIATDCLAGPRELLMDEMDYVKPLRKLEICQRGILVSDDKTEDDGTTRYMSDAMRLLCTSENMAEYFVRNEQKYMKRYTNQQILDQWIKVIGSCKRNDGANVLAKEEETLKESKYIVIYGAGLEGKTIYRLLSEQYKIDCFVVSRKEKEEKSCLGIPLKEITELKYSPDETAVIIGVGYGSQNDVIDTLDEYGYNRIVFPYIESRNNADQ